MLRAADVAVMLLWCLWPMRVVLPGGLTLCQSISTRTILHQCAPHLRANSTAEIPLQTGFSELRPIGLAQLLPGLRRNLVALDEVQLLQRFARSPPRATARETRFGQLVLQRVALGQGREHNDGTTGTHAVQHEAPENSCGDMGDLWTAFRTLVRPASVDDASHVG